MTVVTLGADQLPAAADLDLYQGDARRMTLVVWTDNTKTTHQDVSSWVFTSQIRRDRDERAPDGSTPAPLAAWTFDMTNASAGVVIGTLPDDTLLPPFGEWDLQVNRGTGPETIASGSVTVLREVTR